MIKLEIKKKKRQTIFGFVKEKNGSTFDRKLSRPRIPTRSANSTTTASLGAFEIDGSIGTVNSPLI